MTLFVSDSSTMWEAQKLRILRVFQDSARPGNLVSWCFRVCVCVQCARCVRTVRAVLRAVRVVRVHSARGAAHARCCV